VQLASFSTEHGEASWSRLMSCSRISSRQPFFQSISSAAMKFKKVVTMSAANDREQASARIAC